MRWPYKHRKVFLALLLKASAIIIFESFFTAPAIAKTSSFKTGLITKFPFMLMDGGIIIFKATIGNYPDTLNFILDTGCGGVSLDSATVEDLKLASTISTRTLRGIAQFKQARFVYNQTFHLPHLAIDSFEYHINDYGFLKEEYGVKINGVVGYSFLKKFAVKIDYDACIIEVWKPGFIRYPKAGSLLPFVIENLPMIKANIQDKTSIESSYIFDTGADLGLLLTQRFVGDSNVLSENKKVYDVQAEGPGGTQPMQFVAVPGLRIGESFFKNVPSLTFNDEYNVTLYPKSVGIIGSELLHRFNLIIDYPARLIHMLPNTHFKETFNYSYTGFKIFDINGEIVIDNIIKNSPAEKAGLQPGDVVFGINNRFSNDLYDLQQAIQSARGILKVVVIRDKKIETINVAVESIL